MKQKIIIVMVVMIIACIFAFPKQEEPTYYYQNALTIDPIEVVVTGEVMLPDTYYFFEAITVYDVIQMAGGLTVNADETTISYTKVINQNTILNVDSFNGDMEEPTMLINVNEANFSELIDIPYVSESMAAYLIMYREEHGDFMSLDDLINVKYIGAVTLEKIKPYLKLS